MASVAGSAAVTDSTSPPPAAIGPTSRPSASKRTSSRLGSCTTVYAARGTMSMATRVGGPPGSCWTVTRGTRRSPTTISRDAFRTSTRDAGDRRRAPGSTVSGGTSHRDPSRTGGDGSERIFPPIDASP